MNNDNMSSNKIDRLIKSKDFVKLYLINGVKLDGVIISQDAECLEFTTQHSDKTQLVFKNAMASITPSIG